MANLLITKENLDLDNSFKVEGNKVKLHENVSAEVAKQIDITAKLEPITQKIEEVNSTIRVSVADVISKVNTVNSTLVRVSGEVDTLTQDVTEVKAKAEQNAQQLVSISPKLDKVDELEEKVQAVESVTVTAKNVSGNLDKLANFTISELAEVNATLSNVFEFLEAQDYINAQAFTKTVELQDLAGNSIGYVLSKPEMDKVVKTYTVGEIGVDDWAYEYRAFKHERDIDSQKLDVAPNRHPWGMKEQSKDNLERSFREGTPPENYFESLGRESEEEELEPDHLEE